MDNMVDIHKKNEQNMDALVLFCMELLENVAEITSALKMIGERLCDYFELDNIVFAEHSEGRLQLLYNQDAKMAACFVNRLCVEPGYQWEELVHLAQPDGVLTCTQKDLVKEFTGDSHACFVALSSSVQDFRGSMILVDRGPQRDWESERSTLVRIANQVFYKLRTRKREAAARRAMDFKLNFDALTGLAVYNRLIEDVDRYIQHYGARNLACVYTDFSGFQYYNEIYGYELGDFILKHFAELVSERYGENGLFSRLSSDNFVGFIHGMDFEEFVEDYKVFARAFTEECNQEYPMTNLVLASGIYQVQEQDVSVATMIDNANEARKKCKEQQAETMVRVYTEDLRLELENIRMINSNILKGLKNGEFHAYLQPKVSLKSGKIEGAEALVRWIRKDGSRVMPDQFIDIAEQNGYITKIDFAVLEQVLIYLEESMEKGEEVVPISVNFSRRNNEYDNFVPRVLERLDAHKVSHHLIEAEVTESMYMADLSKVDNNMRKLREQGVEVSVDDFGSGYSSLNILAKVSADTVKLDRMFLNNANKDERGLTVIQYLTKMLKRLGFTVIAEGVETEEQLKWLRMADCDMVQGFYYAKPMSISDFKIFLRDFNATARSMENE